MKKRKRKEKEDWEGDGKGERGKKKEREKERGRRREGEGRFACSTANLHIRVPRISLVCPGPARRQVPWCCPGAGGGQAQGDLPASTGTRSHPHPQAFGTCLPISPKAACLGTEGLEAILCLPLPHLSLGRAHLPRSGRQ